MLPASAPWARTFAAPGIFRFFFQAEDGIRFRTVTGVQTCALPIYVALHEVPSQGRVRRRGTLEVHTRSTRERPERRAGERLRHDVRCERAIVALDDGEAHARDRDAVIHLETFDRVVRRHLDARTRARRFYVPHGPDLLDD